MGSVISTATSGLGALVGNAISLPFNALSCEGVCSGIWDLLCFIEHLCVASVLKFFLAVLLVLVVLYAFYLLCKLGVIKCLAKNACKAVYKPCWGCCRALGHLVRKVCATERVYRGRRAQPDVELGGLSTSGSSDYTAGSSSPPPSFSDFSGHHRGGAAGAADRSRKERDGRKDRLRQSLRPRRATSKVEHAMRMSRESERRRYPHHHHATGPRGKEVSSSLHAAHGEASRAHPHAHRRASKLNHGDAT